MKHARLELALVAAALSALSIAATAFVNHSGWTLYYPDAEAHLNIARRIVDSRTPGYEQIGTVWLPLPHVLALPFIGNDAWWRTGLAGAIPSSIGFVLAGLFLFAAARRAFQSTAAALASLGVFALNPNLLYLQSTPMNEPVFFAALLALLYFTVRFRQTQSFSAVIGAGIAATAATLTRYEGWILIPFVPVFCLIAARRRKLITALAACAIAALGPLYWLAHNWWAYSNALEFYNGPYSAHAITGTLARGSPLYPGDQDWAKAWLYLRAAVQLCTGWAPLINGALGLLIVLWKRSFWPVFLLALPPAFYVWSIHSGGTPIYVPHLWPNTYYNTRFGLSALPLLAFCGGGLALIATRKMRVLFAILVPLAALLHWLVTPHPEAWICWKESQVNSEEQRAWTREAAHLMKDQYKRGTGIFTRLGSLGGILREAGIPVREALQENNEAAWWGATKRPDLFLHEEWAIAISGDPVATAVQRATFKNGPRYYLVRTIMIKNAPVIEIYKRD